jgi:hypothetical protein
MSAYKSIFMSMRTSVNYSPPKSKDSEMAAFHYIVPKRGQTSLYTYMGVRRQEVGKFLREIYPQVPAAG